MKKTLTVIALALLAAAPQARAQQNGKKAKAYMVSDAHLDTQWNWDIQTTIKDYVWKTLSQNLHLLDTYPDYVFNFEGAQKYAWMKEYHPAEYERMKKYIAEGRWHLTGTSWDANETCIVSPESYLRNILQGQTYYRREFGKESTDLFLPDCFGFSYFIPTLANHCGLIGFSSQKLGWRTNPFYDGNKRYPYTIGLWQGVDGSRIMMAHGFGYGDRYPEHDLSTNKRLMRQIQESPLNMVYKYYGTGDTGGSPDIPSVRAVMWGKNRGEGDIEIVSATSDQLYKDFLPYENHPELPVFDGELYMDVHGVGCYTSQAAMKLYNRQNEHLADAAERSAVVADWLGTKAYPKKDIAETWQRVLLHQFHDDLPGTSTPRVYEFSWNDELISANRFSNILTSSVSGIASQMNTQVQGFPVVLVNTEAYDVNTVAEVKLPEMVTGFVVTDQKGKRVPSQVVYNSKGEASLLIRAHVPATGYAVYGVKPQGRADFAIEGQAKKLENSVYKLELDENGNIKSLIDKRCGKQLVAEGKSIGLVVFDDCRSEAWPAWEILKHTVDKEPLVINTNVETIIVEDGAVRKALKVTKTYGSSTFTQYIRMYEGADADRIDIYNEVEWHSLNSLLKVQFPLAVSNEKATYDLGLGAVERGNNRDNMYEVYSHEWTDLTDQSGDYGVTILNDCKYGWDKPNDNTIRLSLLFAPKPARGYAYQDHQDMGWHRFTYSIVGHKGALDKNEAVRRSTTMNSPLRAFVSPKHNGELGREFSFAKIDNPNLTVRAIKMAEETDEVVVRVYENSGKAEQQGAITFAANIVAAVEADGTEKTIGGASFEGSRLNVKVKPFSLKTYKLKLDNPRTSSNLLDNSRTSSHPVALPFNRRCFSSNLFRAGADFEGGNSYAAELMPAEGLDVDDVHFAMGEMDARNGLACHGDTIALPEGMNRLYVLAASTRGDRDASFTFGTEKTTVNVPYYTGFVGQWGHAEHTRGYWKEAEVAYVGTHRHNAQEDEAYELTYMFKFGFDIPEGVKEVYLPSDENVVIFAMTAVKEDCAAVLPACTLFSDGNKDNELGAKAEKETHQNLLKGAKVLAVSGEVNENEKVENLLDGNEETKWCDTSLAPNYVVYDLGEKKQITGWSMLNAGMEASSYITRCAMLEGRNSPDGEWQLLDLLDGNKANYVDRKVKNPGEYRYVRLYITGPTQEVRQDALRIYELCVY